MNYTLTQRIQNWICSKFGHKSFIDHDCPSGTEPEVCKRCNKLISTQYSRRFLSYSEKS